MLSDRSATREDFRGDLRQRLVDAGADLVGYASLKDITDGEAYAWPSAVSIGVKLLDTIIDSVKNGPTMTYYHHYRTVNTTLDQLALLCAKYLERQGYDALPIPASQTVDAKEHRGLFQHKTAARLSGLGWIGKSALLITPQYGPRVRFSTVLTSAPFESDIVPEGFSWGCASCQACVRMCPAGAFTGEVWSPGSERKDIYDAHRCSNYMREHFSGVGRGSVCGICVSSCPRGRR